MLGRKETWFHRNRGFVLGFAAVVVLLNIALYILLPSETPVLSSGTGVEYSTADEAFAASHEVELKGVLTKRSFRPSTFEGEVRIDGAVWTRRGTHDTDGWSMELQSAAQSVGENALTLLDVRGALKLEAPVLLVASGEADRAVQSEPALKNGTHFISLTAGSRAVALRQFRNAYPELAE